jgi:hypothetical protein
MLHMLAVVAEVVTEHPEEMAALEAADMDKVLAADELM